MPNPKTHFFFFFFRRSNDCGRDREVVVVAFLKQKVVVCVGLCGSIAQYKAKAVTLEKVFQLTVSFNRDRIRSIFFLLF